VPVFVLFGGLCNETVDTSDHSPLIYDGGRSCVIQGPGWDVEDAEYPFGKENPVTIQGKRIVNTGEPPWQITDTRISITLNNPNIQKATLLNPSGYTLRDIKLLRHENGAISLRLPPEAMYVVLDGQKGNLQSAGGPAPQL